MSDVGPPGPGGGEPPPGPPGEPPPGAVPATAHELPARTSPWGPPEEPPPWGSSEREDAGAPPSRDPTPYPRSAQGQPGWVRPGGTLHRPVPRRWAFWLSPADQPRWARPALLVVAGLAALSYAWGLDNAALEPFYGAAARSMSMSWHDFLYGAFDPAGTVTVDKLPGALWLQALALRAFGVNTWAFVMPQVVEGILTVLVLFRAVRRLAGPEAGMVAAVVLAASPVTVLLNRGNISDSLLILLLVLAADATALALTTGRLRSLVLAGMWVGLAFQAKMTQAWLVLPALWLAYLVASPARAGRRVGHVVVATLVTAVVSLSWMLAVTAVPKHDRPYVDGSRNDSELSQVFDYNGWARFDHPGAFSTSVGPLAPFLAVGLEARTLLNASTATIGPGWHRLLSGPLGRDTAWLFPAALLAALAVFLARRRRPRVDPVRAACVLWGTWLVAHFVVFSDGVYLNSYYTAALSPAIAALCGVGLSVVWRSARAPRRHGATEPTGDGPSAGGTGGILVGVAASLSAGYAVFLLPAGSGVRPWLVPTVTAAAVVADVVVLLWVLGPRGPERLGPVAVAAAALVALLVPSVACATVVADGLGPFDTPFEPASVTVVTGADAREAVDRAAVVDRRLESVARRTGTSILFVTDTSAVAAMYILASGREVLPIGGFTGAIPAPTLTEIRADIAFGQLNLAVLPVTPPSHDGRVIWIETHCHVVQIDRPTRVRFGVYDCQGVT